MDFGTLLLLLAFVATLISAVLYFQASRNPVSENGGRGKKKKAAGPVSLTLPRIAYYAATGLIVFATGYLFFLFLTHQYQYSYVYRYSSNSLPLGYLISGVWAGQEGSFLFWSCLIAIMGVPFLRGLDRLEAPAMVMVNLVQGFFLVILLKASPFAVQAGNPVDGGGLNPLLQNPWMVVHPPILFLGYAAATFPFALALAALKTRLHDGFLPRALPWTLFASVTLGAGIIIGGYWAYKVLGWGGYWGWDPVENSSLIPWLTIMALFHGLLVQKFRGALARTNYLLAIITFGLVIYATFLTRSGVLADFSVHSFTDMGINTYLVAFIAHAMIIGLVIFYRNQGSLKREAIDFSGVNKENVLLFSMWVFLASATVTFLGTSSPLYSGLFGQPFQAGIDFYNTVHLPIGIMMGLLLGLAPMLRWREPEVSGWVKKILPSVALAAVAVAIAVWSGITSPTYLVFTATGAFALFSNLIVTVQFMLRNWRTSGAPLAHLGVGMLLIGIIASGVLEERDIVDLQKGTPGQIFDRNLTYTGMKPVPNGKDIMALELGEEGDAMDLEPRFYFSQYNRSMMGEPAIRSTWLYDIYIEPQERRNVNGGQPQGHRMVLSKGQEGQMGDFTVRFKGFAMGGHTDHDAGMRVGADLEIVSGTATYSVVPAIVIENDHRHSHPASFDSGHEGAAPVRVALNQIDAGSKSVELIFADLPGHNHPAPVEEVTVVVSRKPLMAMVWGGTIILLLGTILAFARRRDEATAA